MSDDNWHSLGSFNGDWYYMKINEYGFDCDDDFECDFEIYKNDDEKPIMTITENLPDNIMKDIEEVIERVKHEYREWLYAPDYEEYKERESERKRDAQEAWLLRDSSK